jgi:uncharacterized protein Yka (UPF0111/DUF47 family)
MSKYKASDLEKNWGKDLERRGVFNETKREGELKITKPDFPPLPRQAYLEPTKSQPNISEVMKEARKWLEENEFISYRVDGATDEIWEADQLVVNRLVYLINKAIKEAFEKTRPKERETILIKPEWICKEMFSIEFEKSPMKKIIDNSYISGYNQCLQELKSNEEEYLK